ncbi:MAG: alkaline shock response membrane anchor protein AmaP [Clostridia bacterium]|nr:alkaline shock response membrane anchor protein AmaP [Clostridia bacterium]
MKNRISTLNRTLIAAYAILGAIITIMAAVAIYSGMEIHVFNYVITLNSGAGPVIAVAIAAIGMLIWSYALLRAAFGRRGSLDNSSVSLSDNENGNVRISIQAMDSLVKRAIGDLSGIASIKTNVLGNEDSISVEVNMALESDVHIPNATMLLQRTVKNFIEEYSGIAVRDVSVLVTSVASPIVVPKQLAIETMPKKPVADGDEAIPQPEQASSPASNEEAAQSVAEQAEPQADGDEVESAPEARVENEIEDEVGDEIEIAGEPETEAVNDEQSVADDEPQIIPQADETEILVDVEPQAEIEDDSEIAAFEPDSHVISDGLPVIDEADDESQNAFDGFHGAVDDEAEYYSPYETKSSADQDSDGQ